MSKFTFTAETGLFKAAERRFLGERFLSIISYQIKRERDRLGHRYWKKKGGVKSRAAFGTRGGCSGTFRAFAQSDHFRVHAKTNAETPGRGSTFS